MRPRSNRNLRREALEQGRVPLHQVKEVTLRRGRTTERIALTGFVGTSPPHHDLTSPAGGATGGSGGAYASAPASPLAPSPAPPSTRATSAGSPPSPPR